MKSTSAGCTLSNGSTPAVNPVGVDTGVREVGVTWSGAASISSSSSPETRLVAAVCGTCEVTGFATVEAGDLSGSASNKLSKMVPAPANTEGTNSDLLHCGQTIRWPPIVSGTVTMLRHCGQATRVGFEPVEVKVFRSQVPVVVSICRCLINRGAVRLKLSVRSSKPLLASLVRLGCKFIVTKTGSSGAFIHSPSRE